MISKPINLLLYTMSVYHHSFIVKSHYICLFSLLSDLLHTHCLFQGGYRWGITPPQKMYLFKYLLQWHTAYHINP